MIPLDLTVTLRKSSGEEVPIHRTPAGRQQGATPIGRIAIAFGRPSPRDHADPSTITLTIDQPAGQDPGLDFDAVIIIRAATRNPVITVTLARCFVQNWHREHISDTYDRYTVTCQDIVGRARGWKVGASPWPQEPANTRLGRVRALAPNVLHPSFGIMGGTAAPRDVDNQDIVELTSLVIPPHLAIIGTPAGLAIPRPGITFEYNSNSDYLWAQRLDEGASPVDIPTANVVDGGVDVTRAGRIGRVAIEEPVPGDTSERRTTVIAGRTDITGPAGTHSVTTDLVSASTAYREELRGILAGTDMLLNGTTRQDTPVLAPTRLFLKLGDPYSAGLAPVYLAKLLDEATRLVTPIRLTGPLRRPDIPTVVFITAGTIEVDGKRGLTRFDVQLTPGDVAGIRHLRWRDWARYYPNPIAFGGRTFKFAQLRPAAAGDRIRYGDTAVVRLYGLT